MSFSMLSTCSFLILFISFAHALHPALEADFDSAGCRFELKNGLKTLLDMSHRLSAHESARRERTFAEMESEAIRKFKAGDPQYATKEQETAPYEQGTTPACMPPLPTIFPPPDAEMWFSSIFPQRTENDAFVSLMTSWATLLKDEESICNGPVFESFSSITMEQIYGFFSILATNYAQPICRVCKDVVGAAREELMQSDFGVKGTKRDLANYILTHLPSTETFCSMLLPSCHGDLLTWATGDETLFVEKAGSEGGQFVVSVKPPTTGPANPQTTATGNPQTATTGAPSQSTATQDVQTTPTSTPTSTSTTQRQTTPTPHSTTPGPTRLTTETKHCLSCQFCMTGTMILEHKVLLDSDLLARLWFLLQPTLVRNICAELCIKYPPGQHSNSTLFPDGIGYSDCMTAADYLFHTGAKLAQKILLPNTFCPKYHFCEKYETPNILHCLKGICNDLQNPKSKKAKFSMMQGVCGIIPDHPDEANAYLNIHQTREKLKKQSRQMRDEF
ncbi:hypothetical protein M3Y97_00989600 [Aphelenchoides bicaudatus]|nr:hypothetical protein M3Y97_00989600 [Aphelenchoides bicaudatus]